MENKGENRWEQGHSNSPGAGAVSSATPHQAVKHPVQTHTVLSGLEENYGQH